MDKKEIDKFVVENGPLLVSDKDGNPVINAKHAYYFYTNFGIPLETFENFANELIASGKFNYRV